MVCFEFEVSRSVGGDEVILTSSLQNEEVMVVVVEVEVVVRWF
jgi:hypothetical protein